MTQIGMEQGAVTIRRAAGRPKKESATAQIADSSALMITFGGSEGAGLELLLETLCANGPQCAAPDGTVASVLKSVAALTLPHAMPDEPRIRHVPSIGPYSRWIKLRRQTFANAGSFACPNRPDRCTLPAMLLRRIILGGILVAAMTTQVVAEPTMRPLSRSDAIAARLEVERARLAGQRPVIRPAHMVRYPVQIETREPAVRPVARVSFVPRTRWDFHDDGDVWTRAAMSAIAGHGDALYQSVPADIKDWCPAYAEKGTLARRAFWVGLFSALAKHESTWRPDAVGGGGQWYGLLQILPSTARGYKCRATTGQALKNPIENLSCSVRIAAHQVNRRGTVARGMLDWGPFHSASKRREMAAWTRAQSYCQPSTQVRPVLRPTAASWTATVSTMDVGLPGSN